MITVTTSPTSATLRDSKTNNQIVVRAIAGTIEFHQSLSGTDRHAVNVQNKLKDIVKNRLDKKMSYSQRFAKIQSIIKTLGSVDSFQKLSNRLDKVAA